MTHLRFTMAGNRSAIAFRLAGCVCLFGLLMAPGCVRRRMTVRTDPPGAMVYVDRQPLGTTPVGHSYVYYGTRHIEIVKDGYKTETFQRTFNPPWYEIPPLDFIFDSLWPFEKRDDRIIDVQLSPEPIIPIQTIEANAEQLRQQARQGIGGALPPTVTSVGLAQLQPASPSDQLPGYVGPGAILPNSNITPPYSNPILPPTNSAPVLPPWQPGQYLQDFIRPGGQPLQSSPTMQVTPGGSYRPTLQSPPIQN